MPWSVPPGTPTAGTSAVNRAMPRRRDGRGADRIPSDIRQRGYRPHPDRRVLQRFGPREQRLHRERQPRSRHGRRGGLPPLDRAVPRGCVPPRIGCDRSRRRLLRIRRGRRADHRATVPLDLEHERRTDSLRRWCLGVGVTFLDAQEATYIVAQSQGYTEVSSPVPRPARGNSFAYAYLDDCSRPGFAGTDELVQNHSWSSSFDREVLPSRPSDFDEDGVVADRPAQLLAAWGNSVPPNRRT